jgi:hypothetical protein
MKLGQLFIHETVSLQFCLPSAQWSEAYSAFFVLFCVEMKAKHGEGELKTKEKRRDGVKVEQAVERI